MMKKKMSGHQTIVHNHKNGLLTDQQAYDALKHWFASEEGAHYEYSAYFWGLRKKLHGVKKNDS